MSTMADQSNMSQSFNTKVIDMKNFSLHIPLGQKPLE